MMRAATTATPAVSRDGAQLTAPIYNSTRTASALSEQSARPAVTGVDSAAARRPTLDAAGGPSRSDRVPSPNYLNTYPRAQQPHKAAASFTRAAAQSLLCRFHADLRVAASVSGNPGRALVDSVMSATSSTIAAPTRCARRRRRSLGRGASTRTAGTTCAGTRATSAPSGSARSTCSSISVCPGRWMRPRTSGSRPSGGCTEHRRPRAW